MNEQNLEYLKKSLDYLGFGTRLNDILESAIRKEIPKFTLGVTQRFTPIEFKADPAKGTDFMNYQLNFNKAKENDTYFLNDYQVALKRYNDPNLRRHTFDLERDHRITAYQAYKLLSGYALQKEIYAKSSGEKTEAQPEKIKIWLKLQQDITDAYGNHPLNRFYPEYQFNLEKAMDKYPLANLNAAEKEKAMEQMSHGTPALLAMTVEKRIIPVYVSANPKIKALDVFSEKMLPIRDELIFPDKDYSKKNSPQQKAESAAEAANERMPWEQDRDANQQQQGMGR
ncbi:hypothetical protein [Pedobacter aquatilis]|uniref:hypothetical protein n=1 Tax=Pedobacter aquatilis TaxID=351343 RepID=UPI002931509F|nr:hypothetical protein [Pedobacter aquatilis]